MNSAIIEHDVQDDKDLEEKIKVENKNMITGVQYATEQGQGTEDISMMMLPTQ